MAERVRQEMQSDVPSDSISLHKKFFVRPTDPEKLLALAGLETRYSSTWRLNFLRYESMYHGPLDLTVEENKEHQDACGEAVKKNLEQLLK